MISTNRNLFLDHLLDATQGTAFISIAECQSDPFGAGSARSTDSMDVILRFHREVIVDDVRDVVDIDAASGDVGGDQDSRPSITETVEGSLTSGL